MAIGFNDASIATVRKNEHIINFWNMSKNGATNL